MEPSLRLADLSDVHALAEIYNEYIQGGTTTMDTAVTTADTWEQALLAQGVREATTVATAMSQSSADEVQGFGILKRYSDRPGYRYCAETSVYLRGSARGRGLGTQIKLDLIRRARLTGYRHLVAKLFATNEAAINYNLSLGYQIVGTQHSIGFTAGAWRDITILELIL